MRTLRPAIHGPRRFARDHRGASRFALVAGILLTYGVAAAQPAPPIKLATAATTVPPAGSQPTPAGISATGGTPAEALPPKPPRKFLIDGKLRPLKPGEVRPYVPVTMEPEPALEPTDVKVVEVDEDEAQVLARPWYGAPMLGTVAQGARLPIRGMFSAKSPKYCQSRRWLALTPAGWLCSKQAHPTKEVASTLPAMQVPPGERLPFKYVMVGSKDPLPMWASVEERKEGAEPERQLQKGDSIAVLKTWRFDSETYYISAEGKVLPVQGTYTMGPSSQWKGVVVDDKTHLPFGWITPEKAKIYEAPGAKKSLDTLARRTRVDILEESEFQKKRYLKIRLTPQPAAPAQAAVPAPGTQAAPVAVPTPAAPAQVAAAPAQAAAQPAAQAAAQPVAQTAAQPAAVPAQAPEEAAIWVLASDVNEVRRKPPAEGINPVGYWVDVDLGEQVLVAYKGEQPVYATLVSSGRSVPTPMGNYPLWAKVSAITMKSQPYDDRAYFVNKVPWSLFFQAHNAIHGAYWHDRFGVSKSHGCVNVSPLDARHMFEWMQPELPPGWSSIRPLDLHESVTVHIYNSQLKRPFRQERPIGPPDKDDEAERLDLAEKRRAEAAAAAPAAGETAPATSPVVPAASPALAVPAPKP